MAETSIPKLRQEWERLRLKYGVADSPPELEGLLRNQRRRQANLRDLRDRLRRIQREIDVLETEVAGVEKTLRYFLNDVIHRIRLEHGPSWSPDPVLGFRVWQLEESGFHGYRQHWKHRSLTALCGSSNDQEDVPHTEGQCSSPPCGIYAAKEIGEILDAHSAIAVERIAVGLVAMTGKVVEHERGYRAKEVTVLSLALLREGQLHLTDDPDEVELLFQGIGLSGEWNTASNHAGGKPLARIIEYMNQQREEKTKWISESPREL